MADFVSNSAYGEDAMLFGLMGRIATIGHINLFEKSSYIDIGCFHPVIDNNTAFLYKGGWRGTLVDPNPAVADEVAKYRFLDQFLQVAVDVKPGIKDLYMFGDASSINTTNKEFLERFAQAGKINIEKTISVECITIDEVFSRHINKFKEPPVVLNIDIEGMDYDVISSYSFKYRPIFIMIEDDILGSFEGSKIKTFMESNGYTVVCSNFLTGIYMDNTSLAFKEIKKVGYHDNG